MKGSLSYYFMNKTLKPYFKNFTLVQQESEMSLRIPKENMQTLKKKYFEKRKVILFMNRIRIFIMQLCTVLKLWPLFHVIYKLLYIFDLSYSLMCILMLWYCLFKCNIYIEIVTHGKTNCWRYVFLLNSACDMLVKARPKTLCVQNTL